MLARIMSLQTSFLMSITLKDGGIQIQRVAFASDGHTFHLPLRQRFEQTLHVANRETPEQIADSVIGGKAIHSLRVHARLDHRAASWHVRSAWRPTNTAIKNAMNVRLDLIRRSPADWHALPNLLQEPSLRR